MGMIVAGLFAIGAIVFAILNSQATERAWSEAAAEVGLAYRPSGFTSSRAISGAVDGQSVEISVSGGKNAATIFRIAGPLIPSSLAVRSEGAWTNLQKVFTGEDVLLRDEAFDANVNIHGDDEEIVALMDAKTRLAVREFVELGGMLEGRVLTLRRAGVLKEKQEILRFAAKVIGLAKRLGRGPMRQLLVENAKSDPLAAVRVRNLEMLASRHTRTKELAEAAQVALEDQSPIVRMVGASCVRGESGRVVLEDLVADEQVPEDVRVASLERLASLFPYPEARPTVIWSLGAPSEALTRTAVVAIGQARDLEQLDRLCALASPKAKTALAEAIARALGQLGDPRAESGLIRLLEHGETEVRIAAAKALGLSGTVRAVEPLLPLTRGVLGSEVRKAAEDSIRRIQGRLGDVEGGRLSVAKVEDVAGAVSLPSEGGELSVANKADGAAVEGGAPSPEKIRSG